MSRVRQKNTDPELAVRRCLHLLGYRFRLHRRDLPGTPDIVLPKYRTVIFVHGCFWHRHPGCNKTTMPKTRVDFWSRKFQANTERDARKEQALRAIGWRPCVIWECETKDTKKLKSLLSRFLAGDSDKIHAGPAENIG